jgi:hypothetical protein
MVFTLKILSSEMNPAEFKIIQKAFIKKEGRMSFRKISMPHPLITTYRLIPLSARSISQNSPFKSTFALDISPSVFFSILQPSILFRGFKIFFNFSAYCRQLHIKFLSEKLKKIVLLVSFKSISSQTENVWLMQLV